MNGELSQSLLIVSLERSRVNAVLVDLLLLLYLNNFRFCMGFDIQSKIKNFFFFFLWKACLHILPTVLILWRKECWWRRSVLFARRRNQWNTSFYFVDGKWVFGSILDVRMRKNRISRFDCWIAKFLQSSGLVGERRRFFYKN